MSGAADIDRASDHYLAMAAEVELRQQHRKYKTALEQIARLDDTGTSDSRVRESMGRAARSALGLEQPA